MSNVTISAESKGLDPEGYLANLMRSKEMPAGSEIAQVNEACPEDHGSDFDFHVECDGKLQEASWSDSLKVSLSLPYVD